MFYFLLLIAYLFLFAMNFHTVSIYAMAVTGIDSCTPVDGEGSDSAWIHFLGLPFDDDEGRLKRISFVIYAIALMLPALEILGLYYLFKLT